MLSTQEIFDKAALGILRQGEKSQTSSNHCRYRGPNGLKCAVGHVIPDELYTHSLDEMSSLPLVIKALNNKMPELDKNYVVLRELQIIHDLKKVCRWQPLLIEAAKKFGLDPTKVKEFVGD